MDDVFLHHAKGMEQQLLSAAEQVVFVDRGGGHALGKGFPERAVAVFRADFHKCLAEFERNGRVEQKCPAAGRGGRGDERLRSGVERIPLNGEGACTHGYQHAHDHEDNEQLKQGEPGGPPLSGRAHLRPRCRRLRLRRLPRRRSRGS